MDLTIPYTFYPIALPGWIAWVLFVTAMAGGIGVGVGRGWLAGLRAGAAGVVCFLAATMVASMIIAFFVHDL